MFKWLQSEGADAGPSSDGSMLNSVFARKNGTTIMNGSPESDHEILREALRNDGLLDE